MTKEKTLNILVHITHPVKKEDKFLEELIDDECFNRFIRYLEAYRRIESNYGLFDKLARPRDIEDFARAIYECMRVEDRVLRRLSEGLKSGDFILTIGKVEDIRKMFNVGKECVSALLVRAKDNPRLVGTVLASLALSSQLIQEKERR